MRLSPLTLIILIIAAIQLIVIYFMPSKSEIEAIKKQEAKLNDRVILLQIKAAPYLDPFIRPNDEEYAADRKAVADMNVSSVVPVDSVIHH